MKYFCLAVCRKFTMFQGPVSPEIQRMSPKKLFTSALFKVIHSYVSSQFINKCEHEYLGKDTT